MSAFSRFALRLVRRCVYILHSPIDGCVSSKFDPKCRQSRTRPTDKPHYSTRLTINIMFSFFINSDEGSFDFLSRSLANAGAGTAESQNLLFAETKSHNDVCLPLVSGREVDDEKDAFMIGTLKPFQLCILINSWPAFNSSPMKKTFLHFPLIQSLLCCHHCVCTI